MSILHKTIPAAKRLDLIDDLEAELMRKKHEMPLAEYLTTKRALDIRRKKEWATLCRAMNWPIEYHPLTRDDDPVYVVPAKVESDSIKIPVDMIRSNHHTTRHTPIKHILIFFGWVGVIGSLIYWGMT